MVPPTPTPPPPPPPQQPGAGSPILEAAVSHPPRGLMPLKACPQCGQKVAGAAQVCPGCSYRLSQHTPEINGSGASWFVPVLLGVALVVLGVFLAIRTRPDGGLQPSASSAPPPAASVAAPPADSVAPPPVAEPTPALPSTQTKWTSDWVNVREGRALTAPILRVLTPGQRVQVDSLRVRWWLVYLDGQRIGYVHQTVIQDEAPADSLATDSVIG